MLTDVERKRFVEYLRQCAADDEAIVKQMQLIGTSEQLTLLTRVNMKAKLLVAQWLETAEVENVTVAE